MVAFGPSQAEEPIDVMPITAGGWRFVSDGVMGGVSSGSMRTERKENRDLVCLQGEVSTANNGGFVQIALDIEPGLARRAAAFDGVRLQVSGNGERYNLHLRTSDLWLPWQSYRAGFVAGADWSRVHLPFADFEPYKTGSALRPERLRRIGVVAIGRDFTADICVTGLAFYRRLAKGG